MVYSFYSIHSSLADAIACYTQYIKGDLSTRKYFGLGPHFNLYALYILFRLSSILLVPMTRFLNRRHIRDRLLSPARAANYVSKLPIVKKKESMIGHEPPILDNPTDTATTQL